MNELRTIRLYGKLGAKYGRQFRMAVKSPAEAVAALCSQLPGFEAELMGSKDRGIGYAVLAGKRSLKEEELQHPSGQADIRIAPMPLGAGGDNGVLNVILGAVLIIAGVFVTGLTYGWAAPVGNYMIGMGVSMIVGGVMQLLAPSPKGLPEDRPDNKASYSFTGPINTQAQGNPVPVLYGRMIVGGAVISAGIEAKDQTYSPAPGYGTRPGAGPGGGGGSPPWHNDWMVV